MTFWIPDAPTTPKRETCMCAQMATTFFDDEPNLDELRENASDNCYLCKGEGIFTEDESTAPSLNMANANCRNVTELLGLGREAGGSISPEQAPAILRRAIRALNVSGEMESITHEGSQDGRVIDCGTTVDSVRQRLTKFIEVLKYGVEHKQEIVWG